MIARLIIFTFILSTWGVSYGNDGTAPIDSIGTFRRIKLYGNVDVECHVAAGNAGLIRYAHPTDRNLFFIGNKSGTLTIQVMQEFEGTPDLPKIEVYTDTMVAAENSYDSALEIKGTAVSRSFTAKQQGNGAIIIDCLRAGNVRLSSIAGKGRIDVLSGSCGSLACSIIGGGTIGANGLQADKVSCKFFGTGNISCHPVERLSVFGIGSTTVLYIGNPVVNSIWNKCYKIDD